MTDNTPQPPKPGYKLSWRYYWDRPTIGFLVALVGCLAGILLLYVGDIILGSMGGFYASRFKGVSLVTFFKTYFTDFDSLSALLAIGAFANLAVFYFFLNKKLYKAVKGVIACVIVVGAAIVYLKFIA